MQTLICSFCNSHDEDCTCEFNDTNPMLCYKCCSVEFVHPEWGICEACAGVAIDSAKVVTLPARNSKRFKGLSRLAQEYLHAAHRIQFALRMRGEKMPVEKANLLRDGLLRALALAEAC